jgi:hypothetical protein
MADEVVVADTTFHLNGMGLRRKLGAKIYVAGLYLEQKTNSAEEALNGSGPKRFVMHYLTDMATDKRMDAAWIKGFKTNSPETYDILEDRVMTFVDSLGDMKAGDVVECTMIPGEGTTVTLNGEENGTIEGDDFSGRPPPCRDRCQTAFQRTQGRVARQLMIRGRAGQTISTILPGPIVTMTL